MKSKYIIGYGVPDYVKGYVPYCVKKGDSLWRIAKNELGDGKRYVEIMKINEMADTVIYPGDIIYLP